MTDETTKTNQFEFGAAVTLGIAAVMAAWSSHQAGLWGGNCLTAYSEAGQQTTHAATEYQEAGADVIRDSSLDIQAKQIIVEAQAMEQGPLRDAKMTIARYLYTQQMSDAAYTQLGLPAVFRNEETWDDIPDAVMLESLDHNISDDYWSAQIEPAAQEFARAEEMFDEGRRANEHGDGYGFANVILTISMFFSGISLVFKSNARWALLGLGAVTLVAATIMTLTLPFAGWGIGASSPAPEPAAAPEEDGESAEPPDVAAPPPEAAAPSEAAPSEEAADEAAPSEAAADEAAPSEAEAEAEEGDEEQEEE